MTPTSDIYTDMRTRALIELKKELKAQHQILERVNKELHLTDQDKITVNDWKLNLEMNMDYINGVVADLIKDLDSALD